MATMYPQDIENYETTGSELFFYNALKDQLPDKYQVFYSVRWFETRDGKRVDSESDFVVYDPSFGYMTIEVKGGIEIICDENRWTLVEKNSAGEISRRDLHCSPYEQAEKSMRHFHDYYEEEYSENFNGAYGFAVAFPWYNADSILSSSSPRELTIDVRDMETLPKRINEIFHYWKNKLDIRIPFSREQKRRFIDLINKRISISAAAGALIPIQRNQFSVFNIVQDSLLDAVCNYREMRFIGGAGTGKTYIGAKKALRDSADGKKVLFTCKSRPLAEYVFRELLHESPKVTCLCFEDLMRQIFGKKYDDILESGKDFFDFISELSPTKKYDSIIIDEAQDYDLDMGLSMRGLLSKNFSTFYVFFDENQNVFSKDFENSFAIETPPLVLRYNIRNTGCIYQNAIDKTNLGRETVASSLLGVSPEYSTYKNRSQSIKALNNIILKLTGKENVPATSIVILSNVQYNESILRNEDAVGPFALSFDIADTSTLRFATVTDFKGMESDVVIFLNHSKEITGSPVVEACEQYVALTRARYYLYVLNVPNN